jgi:hypothetical protein
MYSASVDKFYLRGVWLVSLKGIKWVVGYMCPLTSCIVLLANTSSKGSKAFLKGVDIWISDSGAVEHILEVVFTASPKRW